jgi:hypothetical protein
LALITCRASFPEAHGKFHGSSFIEAFDANVGGLVECVEYVLSIGSISDK